MPQEITDMIKRVSYIRGHTPPKVTDTNENKENPIVHVPQKVRIELTLLR